MAIYYYFLLLFFFFYFCSIGPYVRDGIEDLTPLTAKVMVKELELETIKFDGK